MTARALLRTGVLGLLLAGCGRHETPTDRDVDTSRPSEFGFQTSVHTSFVEEGRAAYTRYCAGCHGAAGDGRGEAAKFFHPRPRNFQAANFKFSSTRSGQLPTDDDLRRTIKGGLKGSAMPPFDLLPARTIDALIAYLKTFSPKWAERGPAPRIPLVEDPYRRDADKSAAIARGEAVYHGFASCWNCHPSYVSQDKLNDYLVQFGGHTRAGFRENIDEAEGKPNSEGEVIFPPDFLRDYVRAGASVEDIYRSIAAGITGTAMPTWVDSMDIPAEQPGHPPLVEPADIWAMSYYVQDLIRQRPVKLAAGEFTLRDRRRPIHMPETPAPAAAPVEQPSEPFEKQEEFVEE